MAVPSFGPADCPSRRLLAFGQKRHFHSISGRIGNGLENSNMEQWSEETLLRVNMSGGLVDPGSPAGGNVLWPEVNNLKPGRQLCPSPWPLEPGGPRGPTEGAPSQPAPRCAVSTHPATPAPRCQVGRGPASREDGALQPRGVRQACQCPWPTRRAGTRICQGRGLWREHL